MTASQRLTFYAALATVLGMLSLGGVFRSGAWIGATLLMVTVVALACHGARAARAPRALVPVAGLAALAAALHLYFARGEALLGIVPTGASLRRLAGLVEQGLSDVERLAAPVTVAPGLTLLAAGGVGLVAVAIDTVAVTLRRAALAGLPLLALYSVPAAVAPGGVSWLAFAVGAGGYLTLLLAEARERVGRWGRTLAGNRSRYDGSPLSAVGRRVGVAAVAVAIVIPPVVPGLSDGILGFGGNGVGDGDGSSRVTVDNPILNLGEDLTDRADTVLLRFTTDARKPSYLRRVTLDTFQDGQWFPRQLTVKRNQTVDRGMGVPPGLTGDVPRSDVRTTVEVESRFDSRWLPLPYAAQQVQVDEGRWLFDVGTWNVYSSDATTRDRRYTVQSVAINPKPEQLAAAPAAPSSEFADFLAVPPDVGREVLAKAEAKTAQATNNYERALALQNWLRSDEFTYVERAPSASRTSAIAAFLEQKSGYCVHFASAMAIMARQLGIPARVSVGFLPGKADELRAGWRAVTARDAHAWPELYFPSIGWIPFEPTPQDRTAGLAPDYAAGPAAPAAPGPGPSVAPTTAPGEGEDIPGSAKAKQIEGREREATRPDVLAPLTPAPTAGGVAWPWVAAAALAVLLACTPASARLWTRRRRWRAARRGGDAVAAEAAWAELVDSARDLRIRVARDSTPRQYAERLAAAAQLAEAPRAALARLAHRTERARYAPQRPSATGTDTSADAAHVDVATVVTAMATGFGRRRRVLARALPASTTRLLHVAGERLADGLDWLDAAGAALRRRLLPRRRTT